MPLTKIIVEAGESSSEASPPLSPVGGGGGAGGGGGDLERDEVLPPPPLPPPAGMPPPSEPPSVGTIPATRATSKPALVLQVVTTLAVTGSRSSVGQSVLVVCIRPRHSAGPVPQIGREQEPSSIEAGQPAHPAANPSQASRCGKSLVCRAEYVAACLFPRAAGARVARRLPVGQQARCMASIWP